jgi:hypothetical protein
MKKTANSKKKTLTIVTILALLITILPVAVMASEGALTPKLPDQASTQASIALASRQTSEETGEDIENPEDQQELAETTEPAESESANKSERALAVADRNKQAEEWGIPAGYVNLFDKLSALTGETREDIYDRFTDKSSPMTVRDLMQEIKDKRIANQADNTGETSGSGEATVSGKKSGPATAAAAKAKNQNSHKAG